MVEKIVFVSDGVEKVIDLTPEAIIELADSIVAKTPPFFVYR